MTRADMVYWGILQSLPIGYDAVEEAGLFIVILIAAVLMLSSLGKRRYPPDNYRRPPMNYPPN